MGLEDLKRGVSDLYRYADILLKKNIPVQEQQTSVIDFMKSQEQQYRKSYLASVERIRNNLDSLQHIATPDEQQEFRALVEEMEVLNPKQSKQIADQLATVFVDKQSLSPMASSIIILAMQ